MKNPACGCEFGEKCTRSTLCAVNAEADRADVAEARIAALNWAYETARDSVLNGRGALEAVLDSDQTNAVLAELDAAFAQPTSERRDEHG